MNATIEPIRNPPAGDAAKQRLLAGFGEPWLYSDWLRAVFVHYEVNPEQLQPSVPFPLDLRHGKAHVSLVAFTMRGLRPRLGGRLGEWLFRPIATHGLLNVRTYVRGLRSPSLPSDGGEGGERRNNYTDLLSLETEPSGHLLSPTLSSILNGREGAEADGRFDISGKSLPARLSGRSSRQECGTCTAAPGPDEPGIYFMAEWIPNRLSAWLGPWTFGLPYRQGRLNYRHEHETGHLAGSVTSGASRLAYSLDLEPADEFGPCEPGSLSEFLLERYAAFTSHGARRKYFRIWHPPWDQTEIEVAVRDDSLLRRNFDWFADARLVGANYSPGVEKVWMGRPHGL